MTTDAELKPLSAVRADIGVELIGNGVAFVEIRRPPSNFFDVALIESLAAVLDELEALPRVRSVVLAARGKHFCAGADYSGTSGAAEISADEGARALYAAAVRLFRAPLPIVAAIQGAAIGGGLGLAMVADFRVASPQSRFAANFARLGFHHGFGLTATLPRAIGHQAAAELLMTGRRVDGREAHRINLVDRCVETDEIQIVAIALAKEIALAAPLAVRSIRATLRAGLAEEVSRATEHERSEQAWLRDTHDFAEGVLAASERRDPVFTAT
ncbi:enoyl-CoA hydratase/isomerase family protein [Mycolicibacterium hodleri]|uniref:Enoyl-CoA hydratase/isomerase family protein n=1 Tax=Mycolicibacterium hodleri TaxID=49897 RepID=A0A502E771_9MYCO|nr:enoyl-CoA hydratase/isomerase family protein [Mycolicibacterium hodleri]TPG32386.1 enoyl-CoA hydratase/isomerase family protein [Mycolicibacterium hodleri]